MNKKHLIFYYILAFVFFLLPKPTFALVETNNIFYEDKEIKVENFIYKDRLYIDLNSFCNNQIMNGEKICEVKKDKNNLMKITVTIKTDNYNDYKYITYHKKGSKKFTSKIQLGDKIIDNKKIKKYLKINNMDAISCPEDTCNEKTFYVPVNFLTKALGKTVEWDTKNNKVKIYNNLEENFNDLYDINITESTYKNNNIIDDNVSLKINTYYLEQNKPYYMYITNKNSKEVIDSIDAFKYIKDDSDFKIDGNKIVGNNKSTTKNIAMIIVKDGMFPIVINRKFSTEENKKYTYISLGDSLAAGINFEEKQGLGFSDYVAEYIQREEKLNYYTKNFSVSGYKTSNLINDIKNNITRTVNNKKISIQDLISDSDIITVSIGANDFISTLQKSKDSNFSLASINNFTSLSKSELIDAIDDTIPKIEETIELIKRYNRKADIILLGFYNPIPILYTLKPKIIDGVFTYGNKEITKMASREKIYSVQFYEEFKNSSSKYLPNKLNIHPSEEGYKVMADKVIEVINKNIIE